MEEEDDMPCFGDNVAELMQSKGGNFPMLDEELSDDEKEDYYIKDTDALVVVGKIVFHALSRKSSMPVWRSMSTNKTGTTFSCTTRSCCQPSPWISSGSR